MHIVIDTDKCTGHGRCYALAPELFDADDAGYGVVTAVDGVVPNELLAQARIAVDNCPELAITLVSEP